MAIVTSAEAGVRAASRATVLQLRAPDLSVAELEREAAKLVSRSPVPVIISSRVDAVLASGSAGVHLPERDISPHDARKLIGERLVGRSVHSVEGAMAAEHEGADYVVFGPVWASATHPRMTPAGIGALADVARAVRIPVLAIGGITEGRIAECHRAGAAGYAAIRLFS